MSKKKINYDGWELKFFDEAKNFRDYQLKLIKQYVKGYVAEVGPGNGMNVSTYIKYPKKIDLYEPTKKLYLELKKRFKKTNKISIYNKKFLLQKEKYDSILYLDVLEHIKKDKEEILKAFKSIKKNGYLIINVPAFSYLYSKFDKDVGHHKRYQKKDMRIIFKNIKYKKLDLRYYDSIGYILSLFSKLTFSNYKKKFNQKIKIWDSLIPLSKIIDFLTFNLFGKSLLIVIKK
tara:strand:- start:2095 stop:2790 length:696 start_codon:yes stop_codon:yes gene_type:complete